MALLRVVVRGLWQQRWAEVCALGLSLAVAGCNTMVGAPEEGNPERRGIGMMPLPPTQPPPAQPAPPTGPGPAPTPPQQGLVDPRRSLAVTDEAILRSFSFQEVMDQLVARSGVTGLTSLQLFQQWWDTQRPSPGLGAGPHCNDETVNGQPLFNGFPYTCGRAEGRQATVNPFTNAATNPDAYVAIGLFNRFDLAPVDGSDCGEYRILFARRGGIARANQRNLLNFEAVLPNPRPELGLAGCRPVVELWQSLTTDNDVQSRARRLHDFYFQGLPGFMPVVHVDNYGVRASGVATGQVRTNQFMQGPWTLREFKLRKECGSGTCSLWFAPVTVKTNPGGTLFSARSTHPLASTFQRSVLPEQVASLAVNDLSGFGLSVPDAFNSGQSNSEGPENSYVRQLTDGGAGELGSALQAELTALGSSLTPRDIVARAQALSCAGCHELSNGANLGGGLTWPGSLRFVHVSEQRMEPSPEGGNRFVISPALTRLFLPRRQRVMESYLTAVCGNAVCEVGETQSSCGSDC